MLKPKFEFVGIGELLPSKLNPRKDAAVDVAELTGSVAAHGIIEPLIVRMSGSKYEIVCGERRYCAAKACGLKEIPVVIKKLNDDEVKIVQIVENLQRKDLNAIDEARAFERLVREGKISQIDIASKVGKNVAYVNAALKLLELEPEIQQSVRDGAILPGHGVVLSRVKDGDRTELLKQIIDRKLSIRAAENLLSEFGFQLKYTKFDKKECAKCHFNGNAQIFLFDDDTRVKGRCLNRACFIKKHNEFIDIQLKEPGGKVIDKKTFEKDPKHYNYMDLSEDSWKREKLEKKFDKKCRACEQLIRVFETVVYGPGAGTKKISFHCTNEKCFDELTGCHAGMSSSESSEDDKDRDKRIKMVKVMEAKRRFWKKEILAGKDKRVEKVIMFWYLLQYFGNFGMLSDVLPKGIIKRDSYGQSNDITCEKIDTKMTDAQIDASIKKCYQVIVERRAMEDDLKYLAEDVLGRTIKDNWIIDEDYLKAKKKDEIIKMAKELEMAPMTESDKKSDMIKTILAGELKGRIPKEMSKK
jgi:ParB/RepB/Spo0J family partition protein